MTQTFPPYDVIIVGAGAAGLMCAIEAGNRGRRVLLLEHNETVGQKIGISGGGRCNFTNINAEPSRYVSQNPRFCYSALSRYTPADIVAYIERHDIPYHEKKLGQLFCDDSAQRVIDALLMDCAAAQVDIRLNGTVDMVEKGDLFSLTTWRGIFQAPALVIATGGLSIPQLGATDFGYRIAEQFGMRVVPCAPGLVPLKLADREELADLSGISFDAIVSCGKTSFEESALITHRGLSGPAILQISSFWEEGQNIVIDMFPGINLEELLLKTKRISPKKYPKSVLATQLSTRLAQRLCERYDWSKPLGETQDAALRAMAQQLQQWHIRPDETEGFGKAEVTCGGIDTRALSPKTMEAREIPGLYFIGEVVDVTGWLGGYNFQWAWASGVAAGNAV